MIRLKAPAKVNLFLEITGKRSDGYHTLSTLFQTISLSDVITVAPAAKLSLRCSDPSLPTDESNLVMRAAMRLQMALGEKRGAAIHLKKVVPMGAGLGGGSSDAATTIQALLRLWKRKIPVSRLLPLAAGLGADVPFFLKGGLCAATGIGERLRPLRALPKTWIVLIYPSFGVATKGAYARVRLPFEREHSVRPMLPLLARSNRAWATKMFNRFEDLVFPDHPALPKLKRDLMDAGAEETMMSGSGSSVFAVVSSPSVGRRLVKLFKPRFPQTWLVHTLP